LIEHHAGKFPLWLAPVQAVVATIVSDADTYAQQVADKLSAAGIRVETDLRNEKINYKVREHSLAKIPVIFALGKREVASRAYVSSFNFKGSDQQKRVGDLSGGERNRLHLAKLLRSGGNLLLLDEPTNDLDVDTLRALEDALLDFAGCAVVIHTIAGSWIAWPRTSWPSRATRRWSGSKARTTSTRRTGESGWARRPLSRTGSSSSRWRARRSPAGPVPVALLSLGR
jgi:ABC-type iron transport system FetAB ATPase subunit